MTIARFVKPLFANMHHHVHAVAGALRKPNVVLRSFNLRLPYLKNGSLGFLLLLFFHDH